jgi:hypothetical protein
VRGYRHTEPYRKALRKRAVWAEPLFAEAKEWHGSRRFRLRRLEKVNAEALMIAAGQNVKRLLRFGNPSPKMIATVAALRPTSHAYARSADIARSRRGVSQQADLFPAIR